jgi:hypothetical protein
MTPEEFRIRLAGLGYSLHGFARYVEADERSVRRWADGEQDIPRWVPVMLALLEAAPLRPRSTPPDPATRMPRFPRRTIGPNLEDDPA